MLTVKSFVLITIKPRFSYKIPHHHHHHHHIHFCKSPLKKLRTYAGNDKESSSGGGNRPVSNDDGPKKDRFGGFSFRWEDLLKPEPDNFAAVGLAGVLTWASLQVLSQLFFISFAILVAALKMLLCFTWIQSLERVTIEERQIWYSNQQRTPQPRRSRAGSELFERSRTIINKSSM